MLHTVGVPGDTSVHSIRKYHVEHNGWKDIGYHYVIRKDGTVELGRSPLRSGAHTEGANDTIGVCVSGDGNTEAWTPQQWESVLRVCARHVTHSEHVCGHREAPARLRAAPTTKTCPGKLVDLNEVRRRVALRLAGVA